MFSVSWSSDDGSSKEEPALQEERNLVPDNVTSVSSDTIKTQNHVLGSPPKYPDNHEAHTEFLDAVDKHPTLMFTSTKYKHPLYHEAPTEFLDAVDKHPTPMFTSPPTKSSFNPNFAVNSPWTSPPFAAISTPVQSSSSPPFAEISTPVQSSSNKSVSHAKLDRNTKPRKWPSFLNCRKKSVRRLWKYSTIISLIVALALFIASLKKVSSTQYGVEYDVWRKKLKSVSRAGGLYLGPVGYKFVKFPSTQITADLFDICMSNDGLRVSIEVTYQYRLDQENIMNVIRKYRNSDKWSQVVNIAANSAIQHSCSAFNITDFQTKRETVRDTMFENLRMKLEGTSRVFAIATSLQLKYVSLPAEYTHAVEQRQRSEEDIPLAKNERIQERTKAQTELMAAEKRATSILDRAYNEGNITLIVANYQAQQTMYTFEKEVQVLSEAKQFLSLSTNGVLSYMANKLFATVPHLNVRAGIPARISRKNQLSTGV